MRKHSIWLIGVILLTIASFLAVFQPVTFSPRKDSSDASKYLRPLGTRGQWDSTTPDQKPTFLLGDKVPVFAYVPQHDLLLGLDLRGGMRVVLKIANRGEFEYHLNNRLSDTDIATKKAELTDAVKAALGEDGKTAEVEVGQEMATVTTQAENAYQAKAQLQKIDGAMAKIFPEADAFKSPDSEKTSDYFKPAKDVQNDVRTILEKRVNPEGTREVTASAKGEDQVVLEIPGEKNPENVRKLLGTTAELNFMLLPEDISVGVDEDGGTTLARGGQTITDEEALKSSILEVRGRDLDPSCSVVFEQGKPAVSFKMKTKEAREKFGAVTGANVHRYLAIVLDNKIISAPVINSRIDGSGIISGSFDDKEAKNLSTLLNAGALPVKVDIIENRTVSASLGADSIQMSVVAGLIGLLAVLVFMAAYYRLPGLMANIALIIYVFLSLAVLHAFNVTLTLPGIAGIIISIGMAVDANVIIFERLKEELRTKKPLETAIDVAFSRAWTAILDSNVASLITGAVLYWLGAGAVRGFAVTLLIGVAVSMFTAVTVTRLLMKLMIRSKAGHKLSWYGV